MTIKLFFVNLTSALALSSALGGTSWAPVCDKVPLDKAPCEESSCYKGEVYGGYHSDYIFRGLKLADESWIYGFNYTLETDYGNFSASVEAIESLANAMPGGVPFNINNRTNLSVGYALPEIMGFATELSYTYRFNEDNVLFGNNTDEVAFSITRCFLGGCGTYTAVYDFGDSNPGIPEGWYHQLEWNRRLEVNKCVTLLMTSGIGYYDQQFTNSGPGVHGLRGFSHRYTHISAPIKVGCRLTITPYVGYVDSLEGGPTHSRHTITTAEVMRGSYDNLGGVMNNSPDDQFIYGITAGWAF